MQQKISVLVIEDPNFRTNIKAAKDAGLKVGVYFFSQALDEVEAVEEASMVLSLISGYNLNYPVFLEILWQCIPSIKVFWARFYAGGGRKRDGKEKLRKGSSSL